MIRFWNKVEKTAGCWNWTAADNGAGYGYFRLAGANILAHRFSWLLAHGREPKGLLCHKCDNRRCVRPDHLFEGSHAENTQDAKSKGRLAAGNRHGRRKLTSAQVKQIRASDEASDVLATRFGMSERHIRDLRSGKYWENS